MARLSYDTKEADLEREFGRFGPIERVCPECAHVDKPLALLTAIILDSYSQQHS